jgi:pimeloyl-ACP methyl ester carboxylesterase
MPTRTFEANNTSYVVDVRPDRLDLRDRPYLPPTLSLPAQCPEPDLLAKYFSAYAKQKLVLDQGSDGACTGFGLAAVVNYLLWRRAMESGTMKQFQQISPYMLYDMARFYDEWPGESYEGSSCRGAMKGWHKHGVCKADKWNKSIHPSVVLKPKKTKAKAKAAKKSSNYRPNGDWSFDAATRPVGVYYRVDSRSVTDIQAAIKDVGAVYVSAQVHSGWAKPKAKGSSLTHANLPRIPFNAKSEKQGGHAFALVGYNEDGFIVQNSWGESWGLKGFAVMHYDDWVAHGVDAWVCALGVPQSTRSAGSSGKQGQTPSLTRRAADASLLMGDSAVKAKPSNPKAQPWSTETAYLHCIVAGNNGVVEMNRPDIAAPSDMVHSVALDPVLDWLKGAGKTSKRIVLYAHGGLNSEADAVQRARVMGPYFLENGIYPIFYVWKTGIGETIKQQLSDSFGPKQEAEVVTGRLADARDALVEVMAHGPMRWTWRQMKDNAMRGADAGHAINLIAQTMAALRRQFNDVEIHLMAHSAGSFVQGNLLDTLAKISPTLKANSVTLCAPACSLDFALQKYKAAVDEKRLSDTKLWLHILSDERERDDCVGSEMLYGKSLLYLVSRGFEDVRKTPLMGLERTINSQYKNPDDEYVWDTSFWPQVKTWRAWVNALPEQSDGVPACEVQSAPTVSTGTQAKPIAPAHGSFDNDIDILSRSIKRVLGLPMSAALPVPVEDLNY